MPVLRDGVRRRSKTKKKGRSSSGIYHHGSYKLLPHWKDSSLWCPHCRKVFKYQDMWRKLGREGLTVWEVAELLNVSWATVIAAVKTHKMQLALKGTQERNALEEVALLAGYHSGREMLYQLVVRERISFASVAEFLDMKVENIRDACEVVLGGLREVKEKSET